MNEQKRLELIKQRVGSPVPNYLKEDFDWLLQRVEEQQLDIKSLSDDVNRLSAESGKSFTKLYKIKEILNS